MRSSIVLFIALGLLFIQASASAHHATAVQYDTSKTITLKGVITRLDWANPHVHVYMDVKAQKDRPENWTGNWDVEFASPGGIIVSGLTKDSLKPGTVITIKGYPSKKLLTLEQAACATEVKLSDGLTVHFVVGI